MANFLDVQYQHLLEDILEQGITKKDRTGTGTISLFGKEIRHKMSTGFPLLTTKKMSIKNIATELIWFLNGDTNIKYLVENDCNIWNGDAWKHYQKKTNGSPEAYTTITEFINAIKTDEVFAKYWGELGPIYGKQWRDAGGKDEMIEVGGYHYGGSFGGPTMHKAGKLEKVHRDGVDQIKNLIDDLKNNPDSRRLIVDAWNVEEIPLMVLPPCHYGFQCYTRELSLEERRILAVEDTSKTPDQSLEWTHEVFTEMDIPQRALSLKWNQRSCDFPLGIPYNIASYGLLLEILAKIANMVPEDLIGSFGDCHIYLNQVYGVKKQLIRSSFSLPKLVISKSDEFWRTFDVSLFSHLDSKDFTVENYQSHPSIKFPLSN